MTARNSAPSITNSIATQRKFATRNSTQCTVSLAVTTSTPRPRMIDAST